MAIENEIRNNLLEEKIKRTQLLEDRKKEKELQMALEKRSLEIGDAERKRLSEKIEVEIIIPSNKGGF